MEKRKDIVKSTLDALSGIGAMQVHGDDYEEEAFIKASNQVDSIKLNEFENIFTYNRSEKAIKELWERVVSYEKALEEQALKLEQANFKEQED